jgi:hypothetical protein
MDGKIFKSSLKEKQKARARLSQKETNKGSDEDYYLNLLDNYHLFEDTKERATKHCK